MINIVTALHCEAKPLIHELKLKGESPHSGFRVYSSDWSRLIISGVGKMASAAATAYLQATGKHPGNIAWLNIGVAGHASKQIGDICMVHKLTDGSTGHTAYPQLVFDPPCTTECLLTVDQPMTKLPYNTLVDMEAFGFYSTALRFSSSELVHCAKVVSDNGVSSIDRLSAKQVETFIQNAIGPITTIVTALGELSGQQIRLNQRPTGYDAFLEHWHFTVYQKNVLQKLLVRRQVLSTASILLEDFRQLKTSKAVLKTLEQGIEQLALEAL